MISNQEIFKLLDNNKLLIRWDNAPFHKDIETFPHHMHKGKKILASSELGLEDVLIYIFKNLEELNSL